MIYDNEDSEPYTPRCYVTVDGELIDAESVEFVNIEESFDGRDLMTFIHRGIERTSYIITK